MCVTVTIYERLNGKWKRVPSRLSTQEVRRAGQFYMTWYVQRRKRFEPCVAATLGEAALEGKQKELALGIANLPTTPFASSTKIARVDGNTAIPEAITAYLAAYKNEARRPKTYKAHELALNEFKGWTDRKRVNQIDRDHLFAWKNHLESHGEDPNDPVTAAWKLLCETAAWWIKAGSPFLRYLRQISGP